MLKTSWASWSSNWALIQTELCRDEARPFLAESVEGTTPGKGERGYMKMQRDWKAGSAQVSAPGKAR